jgi:hypothetical protein
VVSVTHNSTLDTYASESTTASGRPIILRVIHYMNTVEMLYLIPRFGLKNTPLKQTLESIYISKGIDQHFDTVLLRKRYVGVIVDYRLSPSVIKDFQQV